MSRRMHTPKSPAIANRLSALVLFALFVVALLLALVAGVGAYSTIVSEGDEISDSRFSHGLILNSVLASDSFDSVQIGCGPEGDALVLVEQTLAGTFETRIYKYKGEILQEYTLAGNAYDPDGATKLLDSATLDFTLDGSLLKVSTDEGLTEVAIRAGIRGVV